MQTIRLRLKELLVIVFVVFHMFSAVGQRLVEVSSDSKLDEIIHGDTTVSGARVDNNTVYVLERGGIFEIERALRLHVPLQIKSANGEGPPACILTKEMYSVIETFDDLMLEDIHITGTKGPDHQPKWCNIRSIGENTVVEFRNCFIENDKGSTLQIRNHGQRVLMEDCVIGKMGDENRHNSNGRLIDIRGDYEVEKIEVRNTTMYHIVDRIICNMLGGTIDSLVFNQNTAMQIQGYNGLFHLGQTRYTKITNNLFLNPKYMGDYAELNWDVGAVLDNNNLQYLVTADTILPDSDFIIRNNNFYYDDQVLAFFDRFDSIRKPEVLGENIAERMGDDAAQVGWALDFTFDNPIPTINFNYLDSIFLTPERDPMPENWPMPENMTIFDVNGDFTTQHEELLTGSTKGGQLGALNWHGSRPSATNEWEENNVLHVYPNPGREKVTFSFSLSTPSQIRINLYDISGILVRSESPEFFSAGVAQYAMGLSDLKAGVYFYSMNSLDFYDEGKIIIEK